MLVAKGGTRPCAHTVGFSFLTNCNLVPTEQPFQFLFASSYFRLYYSYCHPHGYSCVLLQPHFMRSHFCAQCSFFAMNFLSIVTFRLCPTFRDLAEASHRTQLSALNIVPMIYKMQLEEDYFCHLYTFLLTVLSVTGLKCTFLYNHREKNAH